MLKNYLKIALRNFSKHKLFTSLNMLGLALGMSICLLSLTISVAVYQSDAWQEHRKRIFQINTHIVDQGNERTFGSTFYPMGDHLKEQYPFVEETVTIQNEFNPTVNHRGNEMDFRGYFTNQAFLNVFSFKLLKGDQKSALASPGSIVITQQVAETLFRDEEPMGQLLETDYGIMKITGVLENPKQTHLLFNVLANLEDNPSAGITNTAERWSKFERNYVYVMLDDPQSEDALENALAQVNEVAAEFYPENEITLEYINLEGVVPRWNISQELGIGWDMPTMIFFLVIGLLVLLPAVFNYTNMSIARALKRSKEIGVRKVLGAEKYQIKAQFIVETVILSVLSLIGSLLILYPMKREFLSLLTAAEVLATDPSIIQILTFLIFAILVGIFAGIFPAQYFSRLNPIQTIKGEIRNGRSSISGFKKGLFVFQFFLSLIFVIGVFAIARQHTYALNNNHGFASENILTIPFGKIEKQVALNELSNHPDVKTITTSSSLPGVQLSKKELLTSNDLDTIEAKSVFIGNDFIEQMQMELAWGESTSIYESNQSEERVLVNRQFISALKVFNMQKDTLRFTLADGTKCRIVGILNDLNFEPLSEIIDPLVMRYSVEESEFALITVSSDNIKGTIKQLEKIWLNVNQEASFDPTFLDAEIEDAYYFLEVQMKFFTVLSTLAISISCLGLLGMVSYNTENRTKEIAVRKIMGATDGSLYYLLTKDFVRLIMIGALIAVPVSYVFYDKLFLYYLIRYGTGLGLIEVILSIFFLFFVGAVSIYWQTSKVTKANPATKLRYE